jgi:hypothetical protein
MGRPVMRTAECDRPRMGRRLAAWTAILALVVQVALPAIMLAAAKAGEDASPTELVICTAGGLERIARADQGTEPKPPFSGVQMPCPICLAAQSPMMLPAEVGTRVVGAPAFERRQTIPRPPGRVMASPSARAPPQSA